MSQSTSTSPFQYSPSNLQSLVSNLASTLTGQSNTRNEKMSDNKGSTGIGSGASGLNRKLVSEIITRVQSYKAIPDPPPFVSTHSELLKVTEAASTLCQTLLSQSSRGLASEHFSLYITPIFFCMQFLDLAAPNVLTDAHVSVCMLILDGHFPILDLASSHIPFLASERSRIYLVDRGLISNSDSNFLTFFKAVGRLYYLYGNFDAAYESYMQILTFPTTAPVLLIESYNILLFLSVFSSFGVPDLADIIASPELRNQLATKSAPLVSFLNTYRTSVVDSLDFTPLTREFPEPHYEWLIKRLKERYDSEKLSTMTQTYMSIRLDTLVRKANSLSTLRSMIYDGTVACKINSHLDLVAVSEDARIPDPSLLQAIQDRVTLNEHLNTQLTKAERKALNDLQKISQNNEDRRARVMGDAGANLS